jgi:CxC2 like cysteine cluster associated with KDZ transposases
MGVHRVTVDFCDCTHYTFHRRMQLLRARWFPATVTRPKTAFTFDVLNTFHELLLQSKTTLYDFYHFILRRTDNLQLGQYTVSRLYTGVLCLC